MGFFPSAPDITFRLPVVVSALELLAGSSGANAYDLSIAGLPFILAPSQDHPYVRETAPVQKQQIDTSHEPGEQSLSQWWVRDQTSWHRGAGIRFYDPGTDETTANRFEDSRGVDVWTKGEFSLLKRTASVQSTGSATCYVTGATVGGTNSVFTNVGGTVYRYDTSAHSYSISTGGTPATRVAVAGEKILVGTTAGISVGDASGSSLSALWTGASALTKPWWVKSRIIAAQGASLYELTLAGGALPTALWTHPSSDWTWTAVCETPDSILAAGYSGSLSAAYEFILVDDGSGTSTPTLSAAMQVVEMPAGEQIRSMSVYLGSFVGIGTNMGLRVGLLDGSGKIEYGPLLITDTTVLDIVGDDRFLYAAAVDPEGIAATIRVDLGQQITNTQAFTTLNTLVFAYAWDARAATGTPTTLGFFGSSGRLAIAVASVGVYLQSASLYETSGWVRSGRIRYATAELKQFAFARAQASIPSASGTTVTLSTIDSDSNTASVQVMDSSFDTSDDISLTTLATPEQYIQILLTLASATDTSATATVEDLQVKALPVTNPQRRVTFPVLLFDFEKDRQGVPVGVAGGAWARLQALEALDAAQAIVVVSDYTTGEVFTAKIDNIKFTRIAPPEKSAKNYGGRLDLTLTKLT